MSESTPGANETVETLRQADRFDLGTIGAGALVLLGSLLPYYTVSVDVLGSESSTSANAWHGFFGWFGALLALAAAVVLVLHIMGQALPVPVRTTVLGLMGAGLLCTILALFINPYNGLLDTGHGFGYWLALLATIAGTALAGMRRGEA